MRTNILAVAMAVCMVIGPEMASADKNRGIEAFRQGKFAAAFTELVPLAKAGNGEAQFYVAEMYLRGTGAPQDFKLAKDWYQKAAEGGLPEAQAALAGLNLLGLGTTRDYQAGYYWTVISVIWSKDEIRRSAMRSLTEVSGIIDNRDKADIARDAVTAWRRR